MKNSISVLVLLAVNFLFSQYLFSQGIPGDPLSRVKDLINSDEIILINSQTLASDPNVHTSRARVFDIDLNQTNPDLKLLPKNVQTDSAVTGNKRMSVACGNFLGGTYKHLAGAWTGFNNSVIISIPQINSSAMTWTSANRLVLSNAVLPSNRSPKTPVRIVSGNFFGDSKEELIVGYIGSDSSYKLKLLTVNNSLVPVKGDSINNEKAALLSSNKLDAFDIAVGDFDGDGYAEAGLVFVKKQGTGSWSVTVRIYKINSSGKFVSKGTVNIFNNPTSYNISNVQISASAKDFNYNATDELVAGFATTHSNLQEPANYIDVIQIKDSLNTVVSTTSRRVTLPYSNASESRPFEISAADLNGDGKNDIAAGINGDIWAFSVNDSLIPVQRIHGPSIYGWGSDATPYSDRIMVAGDLDYNRRADIVAVGNPYSLDNDNQQLNIYVYEANAALTSFVLKGRKENYENISLNGNMGNLRHFALALGDFNGDRVRLGSVNHYTRSFVKQPLVILNTPPVHYDIFEPSTTAHDLSGCFPGLNCGFSSDYIQTQTQDTTISVEVHSDWGVDATLSAGGNVFGIGVQASIKGSYDEGFGNVQGSGSTIRVTEGRRAEGDDYTFNIIQDYDFYEYAVYDSLNNFRGHVMTIVPGPVTKLWVESKDDFVIGNIYRPEHEPGNILSYKDSLSLSEDTAQLIYQFNPQTVGSSGSSFVQLEMENFRSTGADTSKKIGLEVGGSISGWGIEVGVNGRYSESQLSSVTTKVSSSMLLRGDFGRLNPPYNLPQNSYYIIPYAYWAKNGALVMDYKVNISGNPGSFWNTNYGNKTDLSMALPWRLDPEKGFPLPGSDTAYRFRSKDVRISKTDPQAGDTITIKARVSNYGLLDVTAPVTVRFYKGNPSQGGTQIGQTTISGGLQTRKSKYASVSWIVPAFTPRSTRIYAVIDPDNTITNEVHENNNRGWAPLSDYSLPVEITGEPAVNVPDKFELMQNYPNPFNPSTTISFSVPALSDVSLKIYDALGREVRTLVDERLSSGKYNITWNASDMSSGTYFYKLQSGNAMLTKKLML
ncbi:MAG: T9SS type A sorting domain-containing protein, partial [Ignavibacteria bacterium]|nr:T9SS type A sorting domain-containing protein [Ignavibacteria bacterium]